LLRINSRYGEKEVSDAIKQEIIKQNLENVIFTQSVLSQQEYLEVFKNIDCYVSPAKGEGFSIQPREAMALGIPVIATNNTGQRVICDSELVKVVSAPTEEPAILPWGKYGQYFNCNEEELADAMHEVKENYSAYLKRGGDSREWVKQYRYENLQSFYQMLIHPTNIQLGDENKILSNCLITNSRELYKKYKKRNLKNSICSQK
nr:hypothetical protein [Chlamydiota bacterium]